MSAPTAPQTSELYPGYAVEPGAYTAGPQRFTPLRRMLVPLVVTLGVLVGASTAAWAVAGGPSVRYACPPDCGRPPTGVPVQASPRFVSSDGEFSVSYPAEGTAYKVTMQDDGVSATYTGGDGGAMELFGVPAQGRSAEEVIDDLLKDKQPDATVAYVLPNSTVGYQLGFGEVLDVYPQGGAAGSRTRIVVMAAVKNDLALVGAAIGPYRKFAPGNGPGVPSGANLELAQDLGKYVNSFLWKGDPPR
ncbi:hypothetical protein [Mycolicibacterium aichiense]|uniref:Uncharacterized protein n=1 Tax=Mycolicibacterium aichiense TaxID=1799 RepID=A0AAD1MB48_9MYCO|nr:hypothetical protein [Mycolicibacterium aichiense]MCV7020441.1 hypothetical protein [Mycolicibacterium aichiense]BBX07952.1 hypothetical protein MAIC_27550 [Mycolicibacterium aichiense]STZ81762.1 Uncharacterised protein [Mycolicibacterium aichiense]